MTVLIIDIQYEKLRLLTLERYVLFGSTLSNQVKLSFRTLYLISLLEPAPRGEGGGGGGVIFSSIKLLGVSLIVHNVIISVL